MSGTERARFGRRHRRWLFLGGGSVLMMAAGAAVLERLVDFGSAIAWALVAGPIVGFEAWFYHSRRNLLPTAGAAMRVADAVTLVRGWLYAAVAGFVVLPPTTVVAWLPGLCYGTGVALDWFDGRIARRTGGGTRLGERLDMAFDTVGFLVAPVVAVVWGQLPIWYLSLSAARYLFKAGRGLQRCRDRPVHELPPSDRRRQLSGVHMVFVTVALVPVVPSGPLAAPAAVLLVPSLALFARDYLLMTGYLPRPTEQ
ncbi:CDP-alcohol phosphatidyltransferase family protein [Halorientalis sp.]|uniref:CDP-alcohol phosphatidyltransferase family protein n=1 Tax=Halorientalis sp. TaxID=1931229 RepID=UPI002604061D|nr:CDP-alcohol phosphatidyltransferase family protein [Halorientalis sp.]